MTILCALLTLFALLGLFAGEQPLAPAAVWQALVQGGGTDPVTAMIVLDLRLPRVLMAVLVGAALGVAGSVTQGVLRNPLAEPGILGIHGGATLAAIAVLSFLPGATSILPLATFGGAMASAALILGLSWLSGIGQERVILIGIGIGSLTGAAAAFLSAFGDLPTIQRAMIWMSGSLQDSRWNELLVLGLTLPLPVFVCWAMARQLDVLALGNEVAGGLGLRVGMTEALLLGQAAAIAGATVAATGPIAFVGLMAPHLARHLQPGGHGRRLPMAALMGATLLILADLLGRSLFAPVQIPAGIVCALVGGPLFGLLLCRRRV